MVPAFTPPHHPPTPPPPPPHTDFSLTLHQTAASIYNVASPYIMQAQESAPWPSHSSLTSHIVFSHILKLLSFEHPSPALSTHSSSSNSPTDDGPELSPSPPPLLPASLWIECRNDSTGQLEFIVSATHGHFGPHPIFIVPVCFTTVSLSRDAIRQRMEQIAQELFDLDLADRVFSVFAPKILAQAFATAWCTTATALPLDELNDAVDFKQCTRRDLIKAQPPAPAAATSSHRMRRARSSDLQEIGSMCEAYSRTTPHPLSLQDAEHEASSLIADRAMYVYEIPKSDGNRSQIVALVAVGHTTPTVASITKIYTRQEFQHRGYATRLLHDVCSRIFEDQSKQAVVSYIPHGNAAAMAVIRHTGFVDASVSWTEWLEIGFQDD